MIRVCTGWSPQGLKQYGHRFMKSFDRHWPPEVQLHIYTEAPHPAPRGANRDLWSIPGAREFERRWRGNAATAGRLPDNRWKSSERRQGYSFKWDAYKFWKQILIPQAASLDMKDGDILVWLDGDVVTTSPVPLWFVPKLLGGADVVYLNRYRQHSEIGFWAVRLNPKTRAFLARMADLYTSGEFLQLSEWHSAFVWDHARRDIGADDPLKESHLVAAGQRGHVWPLTALGRHMRHDKGMRKPS